MKALLYSPRARPDLREIWLYSDERWGAEQADDYIHQVTGLCEAFADGSHPGSNADYTRPSPRKAVVNVHIVFYREEPGSIVVLRILHQHMDAQNHIG